MRRVRFGQLLGLPLALGRDARLDRLAAPFLDGLEGLDVATQLIANVRASAQEPLVAEDLKGHLLLQLLCAVAEVAGVAVEPVLHQYQPLGQLLDPPSQIAAPDLASSITTSSLAKNSSCMNWSSPRRERRSQAVS